MSSTGSNVFPLRINGASTAHSGRFEAFINPPTGSVLAAAVAVLEAAARGPSITDPSVLRPIVLSRLRRLGMPADLQGSWFDSLVDSALELARQQLVTTADILVDPDTPIAFATLFGMAVFLRHSDPSASSSFEQQCFATAEEIGPGVSSLEVERVVRRFLATSRTLTPERKMLLARALHIVETFDFGRLPVNVSMSEDEFNDIAGILDARRFA